MTSNHFGFLQDTGHLHVRQKKEMLEIFTGWETNNRYEIINDAGQLIMYATEDTDCCERSCCGKSRAFRINIVAVNGAPLMTIQADLDCCGQNVAIEIPPGRPFAFIKKEFACYCPSFYVTNAASGEHVFKVGSGFRACYGSCGTVDFNIKGADGHSTVGKISKHWRGLAAEWFTDADNFGVSMPKDMAVEWKAVLLGLLFHIDMAFYEK